MKRPPISGTVAAEELLLACVILDKQAIEIVSLEISPEMFMLVKHQVLYRHMRELYKRGIEINVNHLYISLADTDQLDLVGGHEGLTRLSLMTTAPYQTSTYIEWIKNAYLRRCMQQVAMKFLGACLDFKQDIEKILKDTENAILTLLSEKAPPMVSIDQTMDLIEKQLIAQSENPKPTGYLTGYRELDRLTLGLQKQDMIIVAARPSVGKTAFALNLAKRISKEGKPVLFYSLEMDKVQLGYRLLCMETNLSNEQIKAAYAYKKYNSLIKDAMDRLKHNGIFIQDSPAMSLEFIRAQSKRITVEYGELGLIVLDYLQLLGDENPQANRVQVLSHITRSLKALARELNVPVIVLSQLSRNIEYRSSKKPLLSDLRESGSIEQDADLVLFLHKDERFTAGQIEVILAKHRNGACGQFYLYYHAPSNNFLNARNEI
jgi:replicative DNA helicase|uniref:Replicative DNA helicase n=1 Tax=Cyanidiaceae sp. MX-AZ01 TaxID=1503164 RepID=A0A060A8K3_9RHOD|nr:replication helicase subunit [Cyanidiaceae sp. MX-AZ01]